MGDPIENIIRNTIGVDGGFDGIIWKLVEGSDLMRVIPHAISDDDLVGVGR